MLGKRYRIFTLFGFAVHVDVSWFLLLGLVVWTLAAGVFPSWLPNLEPTAYWLMGITGALGLFLSIVLHELAHSIVARRYGLPMKGITLFIFGGVAEMSQEPQTPKVEVLMALAGPLMSVALSGVSFGLAALGEALQFPAALIAVASYLAVINLLLAAFNMIPAFPLDGGRVLRAILWSRHGDIRRATRTTSRLGSNLALLLIILGFITIFQGGGLQGMWWVLIGMFLRQAANASYQQLALRTAFEGDPVRRFMRVDPVTIPADLTVRRFVEDYLYRHHFKMFPVVEDDRLVGCLRTGDLKKIGHDEWDRQHVRDLMQPRGEENTVGADEDVIDALTKMTRTKFTRLLVVDRDRLVGVLTLKDLMRLFELKTEFEGARP